ncbi:ArnT family glycosyltransferase [Helicobacter sp. 23-1045]
MKKFCDKYDFYFALIAFANIIALLYLIDGASVSYNEANLFLANATPSAKIAHFFVAKFGANDFALKLPNLLFHALNLALIYLISNRILKQKSDSILCVGIYALLPCTIMQGVIFNETTPMLCLTLLICYVELFSRTKFLIYPLVLLLALISKSAVVLCVAIFLYALLGQNKQMRFLEKLKANFAQNAALLIFAALCFALNLYIYGTDISGSPSGNFVDIFGAFALLYSPPLFVYFIYTIYRSFTKGSANLLLFVGGVSLVASIVLSIRQDVNKEIYMFMSLCGVPIMVRQMMSDIRLRLPRFQDAYKRRFVIIIAVLVLESTLMLFAKPICAFSNDDGLFLHQFYFAKELADELKERKISRVKIEGRMQRRVEFYGIKNGGQRLRKVNRGGNIFVKYKEKIIARYVL